VSPVVARAALVVVLVLATSNRRLLAIDHVALRVDWVGAAAALLAIVLALLARRRIPMSAPLAWFAAFVGVQALAAVLNAGAWPRGLRFLAIYVFALVYVLAVLALVQDRATARFALTALVAIVAAEAAVSVAALLVRNALGIPGGGWSPGAPFQYDRARGLMTEPNLFASLALVPYAVALWRWGGEGRRSRIHAVIVGALTAALVCALTRVAWAIAVALVAVWARRVGPARRQVAFVAATAGLTFVVLTATEALMTEGHLARGGVYRQTAFALVKRRDSAIEGRLIELRTGFASFLERPWLGHGPGSSNLLEQRSDTGRLLRKRGWIANGAMFVLHDTGLLGLAVAAGAVAATALASRAASRRLRDPAARRDHEALAFGLAGVVLAWQSTHGLWQMYGYVELGLLLAVHAIARREAEPGPVREPDRAAPPP
jgi:O-antigen ligase